jgi:hypothetical protein
MGLAVSVGALADLKENDPEGAEWLSESLEAMNNLLRKHGLPTHVEPETLPRLNDRAGLGSYPYSFLHYLRRFAAHAANPDWQPQPFPDDVRPADDSVVDQASCMFDSHLLCHSDCEGFYVPIPFDAPLFAEDGEKVPGGMLGSSQGLMKELVSVAPKLGIGLWEGLLPDSEAARINRVIEAEGVFWIEQAVWLSLYEAARLSIEHGTVISFG